jgi:hypothetical protein
MYLLRKLSFACELAIVAIFTQAIMLCLSHNYWQWKSDFNTSGHAVREVANGGSGEFKLTLLGPILLLKASQA